MVFKKSLLAVSVSSIVLGLSACGSSSSGGGDDGGVTVPNELQSEAAPATDTDTWFGGNDNADSSGSISYLVIAESGVAFRPDAELQGLTLEGVGSGTTISHVQVLGSEDDGIEWFGGNVNVDHIVINGQDDDALDFDDGYSGDIEYAIVRMDASNGDTGIEADTAGPSDDAQPESAPNLSYVTVLGNVGKSSKDTKGANFKKGFAGKMYRSVFIDDSVNAVAAGTFDGFCIDIDDSLDAELALIDTVCATSAVTFDETVGFAASANNDMSDTTTSTINAATLAVTSDVALDATLPAGIDDNNWVGAVDPASTSPWWDGWTVHLAGDAGSLKNENFNPLADEISAGTIAPAITSAQAHTCPEGTSKGEETFVNLEGVEFPVCLLNSHMTGDNIYTLTNDYVYVLTDYIKVGNGGVEDRPASATDATVLNIEAGVQIFAMADQKAGIRVTRGATINVNGTAAMPVIMSAVDFNLGTGQITGGTDYTGRGDWGGLVVNGYAMTNSRDQ